MAHASDGRTRSSVATARAGDGRFLFLSRPALDLADTGGVHGYESLEEPRDLDRWVHAAFDVRMRTTRRDLQRALTLRAAVWRLVDASLDGARSRRARCATSTTQPHVRASRLS